jgi:hypothetical protein
MHKLVAEGKWAASQPVECKLYDDARAAEVSLAENSGREAMLDLVLEVSCLSFVGHGHASIYRGCWLESPMTAGPSDRPLC